MAVRIYPKPGLPTERDFDVMCRYLKQIVGRERLLTFYVDHGGYKISRPFEGALRNNDVHSISYVMKQGRLRTGDEPLSELERRAVSEIVSKLEMKVNPQIYVPRYRPILGIKDDPKREDSPIISVSEVGSQDAAFALTLDDDNTMGLSAVGNAIGTLIHQDTLGFKKYLQAVYLDDRLGTSHLSRDGLGDPKRLKELIKSLAPLEYFGMQRKGLSDAIYNSDLLFYNSLKHELKKFLRGLKVAMI